MYNEMFENESLRPMDDSLAYVAPSSNVWRTTSVQQPTSVGMVVPTPRRRLGQHRYSLVERQLFRMPMHN